MAATTSQRLRFIGLVSGLSRGVLSHMGCSASRGDFCERGRVLVWIEEEVLALVEEEVGVHTLEVPYCGDSRCWCHVSVAYHEMVTVLDLSDGPNEELYQYALQHL